MSYQVNGNITFYAIWYQTDTNVYDEFRLEYLKMESYTSELGYCSDATHHYYDDAKDYFFNNMTKNQRTFFANNYANEMARFQAWAIANEEEIVYQSGDYVVTQNAKVTSIAEENNFAMISIIAVCTSSLLCLGLIIHRKKHSK